ncbi:hypothetical protein DWQ65_12570 [Treponema phagedenis]|uniref:Uncharacterized protein n=1 Tax=Treponema phagedenis TaxID=162 RepID=A0A0B7GSX8_TREPH|nr:hypothetical protein [Treponema phagedenis]EFW37286.1 hypothetical protein HMPREF9554_02224 [Treponema phagedenis F0421]NVP23377.1 hypothetical protein [Treponema phagedenis]QEJ95597.1 hypothetical protein FUT79_10530 [Treponema phagedenis]QEJ98519.1 hypothetical protein FUT82_11280 [Treponema phagedenis]QEK01450.1 hypothetical protein FUT84_10005 [Treponema phagedenis]
MFALAVGIIFIAFTVFAALSPETAGFGLGWGKDILLFLRGGLPIFSAFIGLIAVFIGVADIKDKQDAKKEEAAMKAMEENK